MEDDAYSLALILESSWIFPVLYYLQSGKLPLDKGKSRRIRMKDFRYTLLAGNLYRIGGTPMLRCLGENETSILIMEVYKGAWSSQIDRKALTHKLLSERYYWITIMKGNLAFVKKCDQC